MCLSSESHSSAHAVRNSNNLVSLEFIYHHSEDR
ncbi:hypothetical protein FBUS_08193 [Fasciolopsis buskii]|uniref:Uncharacterized protein n=1 Tax=Fasciolopsis buskii TaxID=27845 RepID=A0A8E0S5Z3_9TREM|nr:hypothetical protein FBUS_08193 [Fasciolopsis buski]